MSKPQYDCLEIKRTGQDHVRKVTKGMSRKQLLAFWDEQTRRLEARQQASRKTSDRKKPA